MTTLEKLAPGHNNTAGLLALWELQPPLFENYRLDVLTEWHGCESRVRAADRSWKTLGRPYVDILLAAITVAERQLLRSTYCPGQTAPVTIQTLNKDLDLVRIYNGTLEWMDNEQEVYTQGAWTEVRLRISDLILYSPFSRAFSPYDFGA